MANFLFSVEFDTPHCVCVLFVVYLTLTDPLRIQPWSQDRRNQTKSNRDFFFNVIMKAWGWQRARCVSDAVRVVPVR